MAQPYSAHPGCIAGLRWSVRCHRSMIGQSRLLRHREEAMTRKASPLLVGVAAAIAATVALPLIAAEPKPGSAPDKASAAPPAQNFAVEHEVGRRFRIE